MLVLWLEGPQRVPVGRLGEVEFPAGGYLYAGSARGPGGLQARLARHRRRLAAGKRLHWHIDYLREHARWIAAWGRASGERLECVWADRLCRLPGAEIVAPGFGSSDCRCESHLVYVPALPDDGWLAQCLQVKRIDVRDEELDRLLQVLLTGDEDAREPAALALGRLGPGAAERLGALLEGSEPDPRWWAARALAEVGGEKAAVLLMGVLGDADPDLRACAALALGKMGAVTAADELVACLADESTFVAGIAADALSMIGEPAVPALVGVLAGPSPHVRLLAVRALGRIKALGAIGPLFGLLQDPSYLVRYYAHETLEALGAGLVFVAP